MAAQKVTVVLSPAQADALVKALGTAKQSKTVEALVDKVQAAKAAVAAA